MEDVRWKMEDVDGKWERGIKGKKEMEVTEGIRETEGIMRDAKRAEKKRDNRY